MSHRRHTHFEMHPINSNSTQLIQSWSPLTYSVSHHFLQILPMQYIKPGAEMHFIQIEKTTNCELHVVKQLNELQHYSPLILVLLICKWVAGSHIKL